MALSTSLVDLIYISPVAETLASYLSTGELIQLARVNSHVRAILHGFNLGNIRLNQPGLLGLRSDIAIGRHHTSRWESLKRRAYWTCGSPKHTKGSTPRHCRLCSIPICEACIVRDSFGKSERTHLNRTRYLCKECWLTGNPHRACRVDAIDKAQRKNPYVFAPNEGDFCTCSAKDRWLCLDCKEKQNFEAKGTGFRICFGEGCNNPLGEDKERRRICLWCDRPMTRGRATFESRVAFDQKCLEQAIRTRNQARAETWQEKLMRNVPANRVSRRHLRDIKKLPRCDDEDSPWINKPHFLARLDLVNYKAYGIEPPRSLRVDGSLKGDFRYDEEFLVQFRSQCNQPRLELLLFHAWDLSSKTNAQAGKIDWNNFRRDILTSNTSKTDLPIRTLPTIGLHQPTNHEATEEVSTIGVPPVIKRRLSDAKEREDQNEGKKTRVVSFGSLFRRRKIMKGDSPSDAELLSTSKIPCDDYDLLEDNCRGSPEEGSERLSSRASTPESFVSARSFTEDVDEDFSNVEHTDSGCNRTGTLTGI